jgi:hypothetical protein
VRARPGRASAFGVPHGRWSLCGVAVCGSAGRLTAQKRRLPTWAEEEEEEDPTKRNGRPLLSRPDEL